MGGAVLGLAVVTYFVVTKKPNEQTQDPALTPAVPPTTTTVTTKNSGVVPAPVSAPVKPKAPVMGQKVYSGSTGANTYKTKSTSIGQLDKYFAANQYIGTFLATDGIYTKIIIQTPSFVSGVTAKTVWAVTTNLKFA